MLICNRFFDVTWEGPVLDASGRPTSKVAGELQLPHFYLAQIISIIKSISDIYYYYVDACLVDTDVHFLD
jgi:hypothetical protein